MEPEGSLPLSQEPATCPYLESQQSSPCLPVPLLEDPYPLTYAGVFKVVSLSDPDLHMLLMFQVLNLISLFHCLACTK